MQPDKSRSSGNEDERHRLLEELADARQRVLELETKVIDVVSKEAAAAIKRVEDKLRIREAMVDASVAGLALWNAHGEIAHVNPAFLAMWGYDTPDEVLGSNIQELLEGRTGAATITRALEELGGWIGKVKAVGSDGSSFTVMLSATLVSASDRTPSYAVGSFVDMTYRERLNAMLFSQGDQLRAVREINRGILSGATLSAIASTALTTVSELTPCRGCSVTLFDLEDNDARLLAALPPGSQAKADPEATFSLTGFEKTLEALRQEDIALFEQPTSPPLPPPALGFGQPARPDVYVVARLMSEGKLLGSLNLAVEQDARLNSLHESTLRELASSLAVAVQNAK